MLSNEPSRGKHHKVTNGLARLVSLGGHNGEYAGIGVVKANRADRVVQVEVIFVGSIVALPSHHIERAVVLGVAEKFASEFAPDRPFRRIIFVPTHGELELPRSGKSVCSDGSKVWDLEMRFIYFTQVPSGFGGVSLGLVKTWHVGVEVHFELDSAWNHADFEGRDYQSPHFGGDVKIANLRHDHEVAVCTVEGGLIHVLVETIEMDAEAILLGGVSSTAHGNDSVDEADFLSRLRER